VRVSVAHVGLSEYLASVTAPMEQLRKVRNDLPTAEKEVDKATVDCERCRDTIRDIQRDLDSEPVYTYTYETAMQKERRLARLDQFRSNLRKARSTLGDLVDKENRLKERVAALKARIAKLETATATFDQDIGLPEGQFQDPGALTVLDPWGAPLVQLTPKLRHEAGKATTLDVPKAPDPVKTPDPFKTPTVPKKRPTRSVF
jgi:prefoldin subunit 5